MQSVAVYAFSVDTRRSWSSEPTANSHMSKSTTTSTTLGYANSSTRKLKYRKRKARSSFLTIRPRCGTSCATLRRNTCDTCGLREHFVPRKWDSPHSTCGRHTEFSFAVALRRKRPKTPRNTIARELKSKCNAIGLYHAVVVKINNRRPIR